MSLEKRKGPKIKKRTEKPRDITVNRNSKVFLTIVIGNRQIGGSILQYDGEEDPFKKGKISKLELGKGRELLDRILTIETNVLDSNTADDDIVITHRFNNEENEVIEKIIIEDKVDNHSDVLSCLATYNFKS